MQIFIEKSAFWALFSILKAFRPVLQCNGLTAQAVLQAEGRSLMLRIIEVTFLLPEPCLHGLDTTGLVLLCFERNLVLRDLGQIVCTVVHSLTYSGEADAVLHLARRRSGATFVAVLAPRIDALALGIGRFCGSVRRHEITSVRVTVLFAGTGESALQDLNATRPYCHFCHRCSAFSPNRPPSAVRPLTL